MKVPGNWTGGHEENLRFTSVNINHGPGNCEWWAINPRQSERFYKAIKADFKIDIHKAETAWWADESYLLAKGFDCYHGVQKPGDVMLVNSGTPHWVKSYGKTISSAWNICPKTFK
jgi:hypothetical protein